MRSLQEVFTAFTAGPTFVGLGQVVRVEAHDRYGRLATVALQPGGDEVEARILWGGTRSAGGTFWPLEPDDEVVVLYPDGDPNQAVCIAGLVSDPAPEPSSWDNAAPLTVHPQGSTFATTEGATTQSVVLESLLPDLHSALTEVQAGLAALGLPTTSLAALLSALPAGYRSSGVRSE